MKAPVASHPLPQRGEGSKCRIACGVFISSARPLITNVENPALSFSSACADLKVGATGANISDAQHWLYVGHALAGKMFRAKRQPGRASPQRAGSRSSRGPPKASRRDEKFTLIEWHLFQHVVPVAGGQLPAPLFLPGVVLLVGIKLTLDLRIAIDGLLPAPPSRAKPSRFCNPTPASPRGSAAHRAFRS